MADTESPVTSRDRIIVGKPDVLILTVRPTLTVDQRKKYLEWFEESIAGTTLEDCRVILLDGGAEVSIYRGGDAHADEGPGKNT